MECLCTNKACLSVFIFLSGWIFYWIFLLKKYTNIVVLTTYSTWSTYSTCAIRLLLVRKLMSTVLPASRKLQSGYDQLVYVFVFTLHKFMRHSNNNNALINVSDLSKYPVHFARKLLNLYAFLQFHFLRSFPFCLCELKLNWLLCQIFAWIKLLK